MPRPQRMGFFIVVALLFTAVNCLATDLGIGEKAPGWSALPGTDGKTHGLSDYDAAKAIVLVFTCNHCPVAVDYEDRLIQLQKDYRKRGVQIIAVNVNTVAADRLDKMKERADEKGFNFPYLYDESQKIGRDYGATCTPHVFVLDKNRMLAYMGAIDDSRQAEKVKEHYLRDALDAIIAGRTPPKAVTKQFGCGIQYN
ncbi:MAG: thioredoxin family protein [Rhodopirellula sp.]|nr:thioredoxin family protein [Rhodopirellula sp.]